VTSQWVALGAILSLSIVFFVMSQEATHLKSLQADVWYLKGLTFNSGEGKKSTKIITQNFNGYVCPSKSDVSSAMSIYISDHVLLLLSVGFPELPWL